MAKIKLQLKGKGEISALPPVENSSIYNLPTGLYNQVKAILSFTAIMVVAQAKAPDSHQTLIIAPLLREP